MARPTTISYEQVATAAETITATNEKPTARRIRDALGTGSMATILKHMQRWQNGGKEDSEDDGETEKDLDPAIIKAIQTAIKVQTAAAKVEAEKEISERKDEIKALIQENDRITEDLEREENRLDELEKITSVKTEQIKGLEAETVKLTQQLETERNGRIEAEKQTAALTAHKELAETRKQELENIGQQLELERKERIKQEQAAAVALTKMEDAEKRAQEANAAKQAYYDMFNASQRKMDALQDELKTVLREQATKTPSATKVPSTTPSAAKNKKLPPKPQPNDEK